MAPSLIRLTSFYFKLIFPFYPLANFCLAFLFGRRLLFRVIYLLFNGASIVRYIYVFWLKNPAGFQDNFFFVFIQSLVLAGSILYQAAALPFEYHKNTVYHVCMGQLPQSRNTTTLKNYHYSMLISLMMHAFIYTKLLLFKRKSNGTNPVTTRAHRIAFLNELDNYAIVTFVNNFIYITLLAVGVLLTYLLEQVFNYGSLVAIGHYMLLSEPLYQLVALTAIYSMNSNLRKFFVRELGDLFDETKEKMVCIST